MEKLFDKPLPELREAFVRARFAEPAVFGRADIEAWLMRRRNKIELTGDDRKTLTKILKYPLVSDFSVGEIPTMLQKHASSYHYRGVTVRGAEDDLNATTPIIAMIADGFFASGSLDQAGIYVFPNLEDPRAFFISHEDPETDFHLISFERVVDDNEAAAKAIVPLIILEEWYRVDSQWRSAQTWVCCQADRVINHERARAQRDFDEAVAVSANGTKIVKAEWVVVGSDDENWTNRAILYSAKAFRGQKIQIRDRRTRQGINMSHVGGLDFALEGENRIVELLQLLFRNMRERRSLWNLYLEDDTGANLFGSLYLADFHLCPSPLPEGGREIRIDDK